MDWKLQSIRSTHKKDEGGSGWEKVREIDYNTSRKLEESKQRDNEKTKQKQTGQLIKIRQITGTQNSSVWDL